MHIYHVFLWNPVTENEASYRWAGTLMHFRPCYHTLILRHFNKYTRNYVAEAGSVSGELSSNLVWDVWSTDAGFLLKGKRTVTSRWMRLPSDSKRRNHRHRLGNMDNCSCVSVYQIFGSLGWSSMWLLLEPQYSLFEARRDDINHATKNKPLIAGRDLEDGVVRCFMKSKDKSDAYLPRPEKVEAYYRGATLDVL